MSMPPRSHSALPTYVPPLTLAQQFKAMRMDNAYLVADGEGGVLGFTAARALRFRGCYVSYADVSGGGVRLVQKI